jgi:phosphate transport system permease protein
MDRIAFLAVVFLGLIVSLNGGLSAAQTAARKGYRPRLGALLGAATGLPVTVLAALALGALFPGQAILSVIGAFAAGIAALGVLRRALPDRTVSQEALPNGEPLQRTIAARHLQGSVLRALFLLSVVLAIAMLVILMGTVINKTFGLTAVQYTVQPEDLVVNGEPVNRPLDELTGAELQEILAGNARVARLRVFVLEHVTGAAETDWPALSGEPVSRVLKGREYPAELAGVAFNTLDEAQVASLLAFNLDRDDLQALVFDEIIQPQVVDSWPLWESLTRRDAIAAFVADEYPEAEVRWRSWVSWEFLTSPLDPRKPDDTGLRPALIGSLLVITITIAVAFPVGVGAAIYLEEYAGDTRLNQVIQTNISNLAGVPSIIYGILGLAIFVRSLEAITSGQALGAGTANGRTVLSAGFTLALLILPLIIINAQEAIRAVPASLRQASYGLGATQWQTIWHHVLPYAMPGILTGTILAISRAIGETAPLILVGGATYLTQDPEGPFSIFTALPLIIYRWTTLPQDEFRNAAAAAIVVLLALLLTLNSVAIILRNRFSRRLS